MMFVGKNTQFYGFKNRLQALACAIVLLCAISLALPANAAWNQPTCNPDSVGPTDASCLVSAPLNVSDATQIKTGALTIQDTVSAGDLNVSTAYSGNGRVNVVTSSGTSLTVTHTSATQSAVSISASTTANAFTLSQGSTGRGISVTATSGSAISGTNTSTTNGAISGQNSSSGAAISGTNSGTGSAITASNNSGANATINAQNTSSYYSVYGSNNSAANAAIYGVNSNAAGVGGVRGCSSASNYCGVLGSSTYAALLTGPSAVMSSGSRLTTGTGLTVYATNSGTVGVNLDVNNDATAQTITAVGTNARGVTITTTGTGAQALSITSASTTTPAASVALSGASGTALSIASSGVTSKGIAVTMTTSGTGVTVSGSATTGVTATGSTVGVKGDTSTGSGVQGQATTGYGGWFSSSTTTNSALFAQNSSTGDGLSVETGGVSVGAIPNPTGWPANGGRGIRGTSSTSYGVSGYSTAATGFGVGVYGTATSNYGVVGNSTSSYGVYGNSAAAASFGGLFCNTGNVDCASLGGGTYSGSFNGRIIAAATTQGNATAKFINKNTTAPYGYAIQGYSQTAILTPTTPTDGTAIDGQAYYGSGVYGYSQQDTGVVGYGNDGGVYGLSATAAGYGVSGQTTAGNGLIGTATTGTGVYGTSTGGTAGYFSSTTGSGVYGATTTASGVYGLATTGVGVTGISTSGSAGYFNSGTGNGVVGITTTGSAVYGQATTGYAGYFTAAGASANAIYATNTTNAGTGVVVNTKGIGIDITTSTTTANAPGINISASGGQKGIVISASSTGIDVDTTVDTGIEANDTNIKTTAAFLGGQFYPGGTASGTMYPNIKPYLLDSVALTTSGLLARTRGLFFDGSDIWVPGADSSGVVGDYAVARINAYNANESAVYSPNNAYVGSWSPGAMVWASDTMYVFSETGSALASTEFLKIHPYSDSATSDTFTSAIDVYSGVYDGQYIWLGSSGEIYRLNLTTGTRSTMETGLGNIYDMLYIDDYIWALDNTNGVVYKLDSSGVVTSTITVGSDPEDMEFDGAFVWVANNGDQTLTRINAESEGTSTQNLSGDLTSGIGPIAFDGYRIWLVDGSDLYAYNIKDDTLNTAIALSDSSYNEMIFDGTYLWAATSDTVDKISIGGGRGYGMPEFPRGIILYGADSNYHCIYFDSAGAIQDSTTLTQCR